MAETVLIVGSGGREHELGRQADRSDDVSQVLFANGNAGTEQLNKALNFGVKPTDVERIVALADEEAVDLTIVGPEVPLAMGLADRLRAKNLNVFGPSAEATQLESSKIAAVHFMRRHDIPHPPSFLGRGESYALQFIGYFGAENCVIKADGLAGGKGVVLPEGEEAYEQARTTIQDMLSGESFDGAGKSGVVVQRRYHGPEVSAFVVSDGKRFVMLPLSQDHKRLLDNDRGPNTGGMGAYAPVPSSIVSPRQHEKIQDIAERTITGMASDGVPYQGLLYMGIMLAEENDGDPVVIEYNARFGDPETQVVLPVLEASGVDVYEMLRSASEGRIKELQTNVGSAALTVCLAANGYPDSPRKGDIIHGIDRPYQNSIIHHAATEYGGVYRTNGGRVLYVTGLGEDVDQAAGVAYRIINNKLIGFDAQQYRKDIGHQARTRH